MEKSTILTVSISVCLFLYLTQVKNKQKTIQVMTDSQFLIHVSTWSSPTQMISKVRPTQRDWTVLRDVSTNSIMDVVNLWVHCPLSDFPRIPRLTHSTSPLHSWGKKRNSTVFRYSFFVLPFFFYQVAWPVWWCYSFRNNTATTTTSFICFSFFEVMQNYD